jgi:type IV pilus assembly protein PilQ
MSTKQHKNNWKVPGLLVCRWLVTFMILSVVTVPVRADEAAINNLEFSSLGGNQVQVQLEMNGPVAEPKIFQTDNPSRIALDFVGVKSNLAKKSFPINQGAAGTVYVVEASGRTRVIINLVEKVPYETKTEGNKFYVVLKSTGSMAAANKMEEIQPAKNSAISRLLPEQAIKSIDFRRGPNGEGRILLGLSAANTVVDTKQTGGKIVLNFLHTQLPESLVKSFDVSDFATPVQKIDATPRGGGVDITVTPNNDNYEYSSYQTENLLTVEFRPLTSAEKEALQKEKFPYVGDKLSLNFQDIEVRSVLQILADFTDLNIIAADSVAGNVTLRLNDVPWDQALELILKAKGLDKRQNGNVIMVAPVAEIMKIEQDELDSKRIFEQLEPLKTENIQINYAKAIEICNVLMGLGNMNQGSQSGAGGGGGGGSAGGCGGTSSSTQTQGAGQLGSAGQGATSMKILSPRGAAIVDARTNVLIIKDTALALEEVHKIIAKLDIPVRQVLIEARIVVAKKDFARKLGVKFGVDTSRTKGTADTGALADLGYTLSGAANATPLGQLAMTLASGANYLLDLELKAMDTTDEGEILSNPRVMTSDRQLAHIEQGRQIPYQTAGAANTGPTTSFKDAVLMMDVTPQITPHGSVIMDIEVTKDDVGTTVNSGVGTQISIDKRNLKTRVQVEDGQTVVLGGVFESDNNNQSDKVPWFADIPGLGWLFTPLKNRSETKKELLIFVTPKVVKGGLAAK